MTPEYALWFGTNYVGQTVVSPGDDSVICNKMRDRPGERQNDPRVIAMDAINWKPVTSENQKVARDGIPKLFTL